MSKPSPPAAPDYVGAAQQQGQSNIQAALVNALMGQTNQRTPFGSQTYTQTGTRTLPGVGDQPPVNVPQFTSEIALSPAEQAKLEQTQRIGTGLLGRAEQTLGQPYNVGGIDQMQTQAENTILSRLEPQMERARTKRETDLMVRGHAPGGTAWQEAQEGLAFQETDARRQAILDALRIRPQMIQEESALRGMPLAELSALQQGGAVNIPQFAGPGMGTAAPGNVFGATQAQGQAANQLYSAEAAQAAGTQTAGASILAALIAAY